jgi:hypothetical protein
LSGGEMTAALEGMARAIRTNPGLAGLIEGFGIQVKGRDMSDVALDLLTVLKEMPFYVGAQFAGLFGIDPDQFLLLTQGLEKFKEAAALRKQMAKDAGVDADEAARLGVEYMNALRKLGERLGLFKDLLWVNLVGPMTDFVKLLDRATAGLTKWFKSNLPSAAKINAEAEARGGGSFLGKMQAGSVMFWDWLRRGVMDGNWQASPNHRVSGVVGSPGSSQNASGDVGAKQQFLAGLERTYGLPEGLLDRIWAKESSRGRRTVGPMTRYGERAMGDFQFMPGTAKDYGVDVTSFESSAVGAARKMADLLRKYGGDLQKAAAAYNWGQGNVDRLGLGKAPAETRDYVNSVAGRPITLQQDTTINVNGESSPLETARRVGEQQSDVNAAAIRNLVGAIR